MLAAGNIRLLAGVQESMTVLGLPFTPRRIIFRTATPSANPPTNISHGLWSADKPDVPDFPAQTCMAMYMDATDSKTIAQAGLIARVLQLGVPPRTLEVEFVSASDNSFTINTTLNELTLDAYVQWIATP